MILVQNERQMTKHKVRTTPIALSLIFGIIALFISGFESTAWAQGEIPPVALPLSKVVVDSATIPQGDEALINVTLEQQAGAPGLVSYQGTLIYDATVIEVLEVIFPEQCPVWAANIQLGVIRFAATKCSGDPDDVKLAELFSLRILAIGAPGSVTTLVPNFEIFHDFEAVLIEHEVDPGIITISGGGFDVNFEYRPRSPEVGQKIDFTDLTEDPDGLIVRWEWDFGDGGTATDQNPMHTYSAAGSYVVTLTVFDEADNSSFAQKTVVVSEITLVGCPINYPNPARDHTNFFCDGLPGGTTNATLRIFNLKGELVKSHPMNITAGSYRWDLRDENGNALPNGPYFYYLRAETPNGVFRTRVEVLIIQR